MQKSWRRAWKRSKNIRDTNHKGWIPQNTYRPMKALVRNLFPPLAVASILLGSLSVAYANPADGTVTNGTGTIAQSGNTMTITQNTSKMSINWQSFSIAANETVNFVQPGANSIALNRVVSNNASNIYGHLNANGQVFLINPSGVLFAKGSQVNVGGIVASTLNRGTGVRQCRHSKL